MEKYHFNALTVISIALTVLAIAFVMFTIRFDNFAKVMSSSAQFSPPLRNSMSSGGEDLTQGNWEKIEPIIPGISICESFLRCTLKYGSNSFDLCTHNVISTCEFSFYSQVIDNCFNDHPNEWCRQDFSPSEDYEYRYTQCLPSCNCGDCVQQALINKNLCINYGIMQCLASGKSVRTSCQELYPCSSGELFESMNQPSENS